jgi:hypothetical protein
LWVACPVPPFRIAEKMSLNSINLNHGDAGHLFIEN